jgi:hypothetical protein
VIAVDGMRMVPLASTRSAFEAQVLAARLGSEGIVWQLRGGSADSMYPLGDVDVLVAADDLEKAYEVLGTDSQEAWAVDPDGDRGRDRTQWWMAAIVAAIVFGFIALRILSLLRPW